MDLQELSAAYMERKLAIKQRLEDFAGVRGLGGKDIFAEFCFCLLTPQSKAFNCWDSVVTLKETGLLYTGDTDQIKAILQKKVRFHNNKASYIVQNRGIFFGAILDRISSDVDIEGTRDWLVKNVKGYGYKEASHFMRNIGFRNLAILDRHILKNLAGLGVISFLPKTLDRSVYMDIEKEFRNFSAGVGIPLDELDLLFWSVQTGKIFK